MRLVKVELSKDIENLDICIFSDEHIGDPRSNINYLKERIEYVKNNDNVYCVLGGDLIDNATKTSISDTYSQNFNPQESMDYLVELFKPIKNKILAIVSGNHEARTYKKEGIDIMKNVAERLGLGNRYDFTSIYLFLRFGNCNKNRRQRYTIYLTHGSGGGRKEGAKAIRLADLACICDADVYIHNHTHLPMTMKEDFIRVSESTSTISTVTKLFVNSSANLEYGGYGEAIGCKPASLIKPIIHLSGKVREAKATL